ncbi:unnamed protein product [Gemmata massiliana]|uniref:Uncharacterized protein n=1 Tax=Gemmata massiliana TaxID=1210884 RepID=A0A6P2CS56_9BACT|nr:unnamed protein product [Gemmata massiliana]
MWTLRQIAIWSECVGNEGQLVSWSWAKLADSGDWEALAIVLTRFAQAAIGGLRNLGNGTVS